MKNLETYFLYAIIVLFFGASGTALFYFFNDLSPVPEYVMMVLLGIFFILFTIDMWRAIKNLGIHVKVIIISFFLFAVSLGIYYLYSLKYFSHQLVLLKYNPLLSLFLAVYLIRVVYMARKKFTFEKIESTIMSFDESTTIQDNKYIEVEYTLLRHRVKEKYKLKVYHNNLLQSQKCIKISIDRNHLFMHFTGSDSVYTICGLSGAAIDYLANNEDKVGQIISATEK